MTTKVPRLSFPFLFLLAFARLQETFVAAFSPLTPLPGSKERLALGSLHPIPFGGSNKATTRGSAKRAQLTQSENSDDDSNLTLMELQILAAVQERLDIKRVVRALQHENGSLRSTNWRRADSDFIPSTNAAFDDTLQSPQLATAPQWKIALAAATCTSVLFYWLISSNWFIALAIWLGIFFAANGDPLDEENAAGALARVIGRMTIRSVEASQPKLKAIARAVVTEEQEELMKLQQQNKQLKQENDSLRLWILRRMQIDDKLPQYTMDQLKYLARSNALSVSGTKAALLMRLLEAKVIE
jgi:hypothetical protein